jgi:hypothetical protein
MCPSEQEEVALPHAVEPPREAQDPGGDHQVLDLQVLDLQVLDLQVLDLRAEAAVRDEGLQQDYLSVSRD